MYAMNSPLEPKSSDKPSSVRARNANSDVGMDSIPSNYWLSTDEDGKATLLTGLNADGTCTTGVRQQCSKQ